MNNATIDGFLWGFACGGLIVGLLVVFFSQLKASHHLDDVMMAMRARERLEHENRCILLARETLETLTQCPKCGQKVEDIVVWEESPGPENSPDRICCEHPFHYLKYYDEIPSGEMHDRTHQGLIDYGMELLRKGYIMRLRTNLKPGKPPDDDDGEGVEA